MLHFDFNHNVLWWGICQLKCKFSYYTGLSAKGRNKEKLNSILYDAEMLKPFEILHLEFLTIFAHWSMLVVELDWDLDIGCMDFQKSVKKLLRVLVNWESPTSYKTFLICIHLNFCFAVHCIWEQSLRLGTSWADIQTSRVLCHPLVVNSIIEETWKKLYILI